MSERVTATGPGGAEQQAIDRALALAVFSADGHALRANANFLELFGYRVDGLVGLPHAALMPAGASDDELWASLAAGELQRVVCPRLRGDGEPVWVQATYTPVAGDDGRVVEVVLLATDVTDEQRRRADQEGQIAAIGQSHAVITFDMNGTVIRANATFLEAFGYRLDEVEGRHHRMFVDPSQAHGAEYAAFWNHLSEGRHQGGEYRRFGKQGREVWLRASYNPIRDLSGRLLKVVKVATVVTREKLHQADHQGQIASIHKAQCVIAFGLDGRILDANDNFLDATGYRLSDIIGRHHGLFVEADTARSVEYRTFWDDLARGKHRAGEFKRIGKGGRELWLQASYNPIFDMNGRPFKVVKYATDVTLERLRQADHAGQIAAIRKSQCVVAFDLDGTVLEANENFLVAMGYRQDEVVGRHHRMFVDPAFAESEAYRVFWDTLRSGRFLSERYRRIGKDGRDVWIQASYNPILDLNGRPCKVIKIATDVSASVALAAEVVTARREAEHDSTTGLPNRLALKTFMAAALDRPARRLAVLYLDLDHFKPINDTFGHPIGDQVLKETADRLRAALAPEQMVARIGGDEFIVAAPDLPEAEIGALCQRLLEVVKAPIRHGDRALTVGLSIGVSIAPNDATTIDDLLRCADVALYRTKGNGRDGYSFFTVSMQERLSTGRHLADEMRHGIQAEQFFLEYRPWFDALTQKLASVEVLVRWNHPERGRLEEANFLTLAEKSALVLPLGEWVLRSACHALAAGPAVDLVLNVSPVQLAGADLAALVASVLAQSGLAAERLALSMPARVLAGDTDSLHAGLQALKALGVRLLIETDGSADPSLQRLRAAGFDEVRLDRARVDDAEPGRPRLAHAFQQVIDALGDRVDRDGMPNFGGLLLGLGPVPTVRGLRVGAPLSSIALASLRVGQPPPGRSPRDAALAEPSTALALPA